MNVYVFSFRIDEYETKIITVAANGIAQAKLLAVTKSGLSETLITRFEVLKDKRAPKNQLQKRVVTKLERRRESDAGGRRSHHHSQSILNRGEVCL